LPTRRPPFTFAKIESNQFDMKKRILYSLLVLLLGLNLFVGAQIYFTSAQAAEKNNLYQQMDLFVRVLEKVRQEYVDGEKVSYQELIYGALRGMLNTLDPHSEFMEPAKYEDLRNETEGSYGGVGLQISLRDNTLTVIAPMEDTPAFKAGILAGDKIIRIEGKSTEKMNLGDAVRRLKGEAGTPVHITISRPTLAQPKEVTLTRSVIKLDTVKDIDGHRSFPLSENKIGYVHLLQFGEQTAGDLQDALRKLKKEGMEGLILDLRNNPGGLLDQAVKVCELFVKRGELIVSTEGRGPQADVKYTSSGRDQYPDLQMVVLVDGGSASASEIVAGCLQDRGRAFIMGEQTFGKGSVQSIMPLQDGSALRLTTAKYYTPSHKVIHEKGITPDSVIPMSLEEEEALFLKRVPGGMDSLDDDKKEHVMNARDIQLDRATDFLKGMLLFRDRAQFTRRTGGDTRTAARVAGKGD
jgi:carboxyl-terminal processing protease